MRIVFMGTPEFAVPSLEALLRSEHPVVGIVTQPDRPKGRGGDVAPSPVKLVGLRDHIPILQPLKMKDPAFLEALRAWRPDLIAVAAFGRILPPLILELPSRGCLNVHASLLPKYRGAGPIQWAVMNGEKETGTTTMLMDAGMDTGAILLQERTPIDDDDTAGSLAVKLAAMGGRLLVETIRQWQAGTVTPRPQDHAQATTAPLLHKEEGLIDWTLPATAIANRIRGLSPWPGAYTFLQDDRWTICRARIVQEDTGHDREPAPGTIVGVHKSGIRIATGQGVLEITELQPANGRRMAVHDYVAGHPLAPRQTLSSGPLLQKD